MSARVKFLLRALLGACLWLGLAAPPVSADPPRSAQKPRAKRARAKKPKKRSEEKREASSEETKPAGGKPARPERETASQRAQEAAQSAAREGSQGVDAQIVKEGDTNVKVMNFSGLDIEGRLKSPQLLYFVNRVHAEFERPKLPHRSFMPELERSTQRDPFP